MLMDSILAKKFMMVAVQPVLQARMSDISNVNASCVLFLYQFSLDKPCLFLEGAFISYRTSIREYLSQNSYDDMGRLLDTKIR